MMLPTHVLVGMAIATPLVALAPELAPAAIGGALVGSVLPDLDMYVGHRRTLHYPTGYSIAAVLAWGAAVLLVSVWPGMLVSVWPGIVAVAFALTGGALHSRMDRYGGGLELRPWEATSDRAVYDHVSGQWRTPKRWVRYDGAPEDLVLSIGVGLPLLFVLDGPYRWVVLAALLVGTAYALVRRRLAGLAPTVVGFVVDTVATSIDPPVPERYRE